MASQYPDYIDTGANHIDMNGSDWSGLRSHLDSLRDKTAVSPLRILHIGDSHIQAEFITNELRRLLQDEYGNAGRGLVCPFRLAGTNQPNDYELYSNTSEGWTQTRLLKYPWPIYPGVTGIAVMNREKAEVIIKPLLPGHKFNRATILTSEGIRIADTGDPADSISTGLSSGEALYGAILENSSPGILYSAIGNNGACYNDYSLIPSFASSTRIFSPDLIILSMGTNEGFSTMTDQEIFRSVTDLIRSLRAYNPGAAFLVLTPMECQKNRNHGSKPLSPYYDINTRVAQVRSIILDVARQEKAAVWDLYRIAGGEGVSSRWLEDSLMNKDRIHCLKAGYEMQARLLFEALHEQFDGMHD